MTDIILIAAIAEDGTIGDQGGIPWHHPEDLQHFKETTDGHIVIMGRKTWDSLPPSKLPGRSVIVMTRSVVPEGLEGCVASFANPLLAIEYAKAVAGPDQKVFVAGGAQIYEALLPHCTHMIITEIPGEPDGDTTFSVAMRPGWETTSTVQLAEALEVWHYQRTK